MRIQSTGVKSRAPNREKVLCRITTGRVRLHDVAALAAHVDVVDFGGGGDAGGLGDDREDVRAVLEGAPVLVGVDGELQLGVGAAGAAKADVDGGVALHGELSPLELASSSHGVSAVVML